MTAEKPPLADVRMDSTVKEFFLEILKAAMNENGLRIQGAMTVGGCVFHYTFAVDAIDVAHTSANPETRH